MKKLIVLLSFIGLMNSPVVAKDDLLKIAATIEAEGKMLYRLEKASWHGTDLFMEKYAYPDNIGGYFSYIQNDTPKCVFVSKTTVPQVIGTIIFTNDFDLDQAKVIMSGRDLSPAEQDIFALRKAAINAIATDAFQMKFFENTNPNVIPVIRGTKREVYILTGPKNPGKVLFGNDYLLDFDAKNNLKSAKPLHKNLIPIEYNSEAETEVSIHSHTASTGNFITATDICTLMLYAEIAGWKQHYVVTDKYFNIWDVKNQKLVITTKKAMEKILKSTNQ